MAVVRTRLARRRSVHRAGASRVLRGVDGGSLHVGAAGWQSPGEPAAGRSGVDLPPGVLLVEMVAAADGSAGAQAGDPALVMRCRVLVIAGPVRGAAGEEGAFLVQHRRQVPQELAGVVGGGLVLVVAGPGQGLEGEGQFPVGDGELPGAQAAWRPLIYLGQDSGLPWW